MPDSGIAKGLDGIDRKSVVAALELLQPDDVSLELLDSKVPAILIGDYNVIPTDFDVY